MPKRLLLVTLSTTIYRSLGVEWPAPEPQLGRRQPAQPNLGFFCLTPPLYSEAGGPDAPCGLDSVRRNEGLGYSTRDAARHDSIDSPNCRLSFRRDVPKTVTSTHRREFRVAIAG